MEITLMLDFALLAVFAHPDDEQLITGTLAQCAQDGIRTGLICTTRGEAGQIHQESGATPDTLGKVREAELRAACVVAGVKHLWFLDYRDSGWFDSPENHDPRAFCNAPEEEALEQLVRITREFQPTVLVTFDKSGGYGHLDHLMAYRLTTLAFSAAADSTRFPEAGEPWQASRLYFTSFARSTTKDFLDKIRQIAPDSDFAQLDLSNMGLADEEITNSLDVSRWVELKHHSLSQHRTQRADQERFNQMVELSEALRNTEHFVLGAGVPLPDGPVEGKSLFAGLEGKAYKERIQEAPRKQPLA